MRKNEPFLVPAMACGWALLCATNLAFAGSVTQWQRGETVLAEMARVNADPAACGLAIMPPNLWWVSGGYSHLRRGLALAGVEPDASAMTGFDYAMAPGEINLRHAGMVKIMCGAMVMPGEAAPVMCLWHYPGGCAGPPAPPLVSPDPMFFHPGKG